MRNSWSKYSENIYICNIVISLFKDIYVSSYISYICVKL